jgi:hypothetical protein
LRVSPTSITGSTGIGQHDLLERHHPAQALILLVEHVDGVDRLLRLTDLTDVGLDLIDVPSGRDAHELRRHDAAGTGGGIPEEQVQRVARGRVEHVDQASPRLVGQLAEELDLLVRGHRFNERDRPPRLEACH